MVPGAKAKHLVTIWALSAASPGTRIRGITLGPRYAHQSPAQAVSLLGKSTLIPEVEPAG